MIRGTCRASEDGHGASITVLLDELGVPEAASEEDRLLVYAEEMGRRQWALARALVSDQPFEEWFVQQDTPREVLNLLRLTYPEIMRERYPEALK